MNMSDGVRNKLVMKGLTAGAAASLFALVGCAMQPTQSSQSAADYAQADSRADRLRRRRTT